MNYRKLINPKGSYYQQIKEFANGNSIPWFWNVKCDETPDYYRHIIVDRPEANLCSNVISPPAYEYAKNFFKDLCVVNELNTNYILRMAINCIHPQSKVTPTHKDHYFPHANIIVYLNNGGGDTIVEGERFSPSEDDIICFDGIDHQVDLRTVDKRRIVMIITVDRL